MKYRFSLQARADLVAARDFYESRREELGIEFLVEVGLALGKILEAPRRWPEIEPGYRRYRLDRFPFAMIYQPTSAQSVDIIAVFDLRSEPGSWRRDS